jgi:hypothetical protein
MLKFKKVASILASSSMLLSTVGLAMAANYPAPFNQGATAIVWGGVNNAQPTDLVAVTDIMTGLTANAVSDGVTGSTSDVQVTGGDSIRLAKASNEFNLGEDTNDFYTILDNGELSTVLADGQFLNDQNNEFEYTQEIRMGASALQFFEDSEFNEYDPMIGFDLANGDHILNYTLEFDTDAEGGTSFGDLENTDLEMLGKVFYISDVTSTSNGMKITLLDTANSATVEQGETTTLTVGDKTYDVSILFPGTSTVKLSINGEATNALADGQTFRLSDGAYVGIKEYLNQDYAGGQSIVEFSIGLGKLVLENGEEVQLNSDDISSFTDEFGYQHKINSYISNTSTDLSSITLEWDLDDDAWVVPGTDLILPGFETIKLSMADFETPAEEVTTVKNDGSTSMELQTTLADGEVSLNFLYSNTTDYLGIGKSSTDKLFTITGTSPELVFDSDVYQSFVVTWISGDDSQSYVLEITDIDDDAGDNTTTISSTADGDETHTVKLGDSTSFGNIDLTLNTADKISGVVNLSVSTTSSGSTYADRLVTAEGMTIRLPVDSATVTTDGFINLTSFPGTWSMNFTEENEDNAITAGDSISLTIGLNNDGKTTVSSFTEGPLSNSQDYEMGDGTENWVGYIESPLATMTLFKQGGDQDSMELTYHGEESFANVFLTEVGAEINTDGDGNTGGNANVVILTDDEVSQAAGKNIIVVGGSCVNTVAATLLGVSPSTCGADWTTATNVDSGQFLIQTFDRGNDKVATLVAGFNAPDTTNGVTYLTTQTVDTSVGKKYIGTSGTSAEMVAMADDSGDAMADDTTA